MYLRKMDNQNSMTKTLFIVIMSLFSYSSKSYELTKQPSREGFNQTEKIETEKNEKEIETSDPIHPLLTLPLIPASFLVPGSAHYFQGDKQTSEALFKYGSRSFLVFLSSGLVLALSGAADQTVIPFIPLAMGGAASWLAVSTVDLIGANLDKSKSPLYPGPWTPMGTAGIQYTKVKSPIFSNSDYRGAYVGYLQNGHIFKFKSLFAHSTDIEIFEIEYARQIISRVQDNQGLYAHIQVTREENSEGFFRMTTFEPSLGLMSDAGILSPGLERIYLEAQFGLQKHALQYLEGTGDNIETDSSMMGKFEVSWSAASWLLPGLGYSHERDHIIASQSTGFTGVFYGSTELKFLDSGFLKTTYFFSQEPTWELKLSTAF